MIESPKAIDSRLSFGMAEGRISAGISISDFGMRFIPRCSPFKEVIKWQASNSRFEDRRRSRPLRC